jgi:hypothetical protein
MNDFIICDSGNMQCRTSHPDPEGGILKHFQEKCVAVFRANVRRFNVPERL